MGIFVAIFRFFLQLVGFIVLCVLAVQKIKQGETTAGFVVLAGIALCIVLSASYYLMRWRQEDAQLGPGKSARTEIVRVEESANYAHSAASVWALIRPAETAVELGHAVRAFTVPGTPKGVGEQQCFIADNGAVSILEVVEEEVGRSATTRRVFPPDCSASSTFLVEDLGAGCNFIYAVEVEVSALAARHTRIAQRLHVLSYLTNIGDALDQKSDATRAVVATE